mgnify:CR=1 FL=1
MLVNDWSDEHAEISQLTSLVAGLIDLKSETVNTNDILEGKN